MCLLKTYRFRILWTTTSHAPSFRYILQFLKAKASLLLLLWRLLACLLLLLLMVSRPLSAHLFLAMSIHLLSAACFPLLHLIICSSLMQDCALPLKILLYFVKRWVLDMFHLHLPTSLLKFYKFCLQNGVKDWNLPP